MWYSNGIIMLARRICHERFITHYASPLGRLLLAADEEGLTGLWLEGQKYFAAGLPQQREEQRTPALEEACRWLDTYFTGREPDFTPPLHLWVDFQRAVWQLLLQIPYGQTTTYGALAGELAAAARLTHFSAQAVGGAVGHNRVSIIIPCHRVVGSGGSLTGYAGGLENKIKLLELESADLGGLYRPTKGTAL